MPDKTITISADAPIPPEVLRPQPPGKEPPSFLSRLSNFALIFIATFLILQLFMKPPAEDPAAAAQDVVLTAHQDYKLGEAVTVSVQNNLTAAIPLTPCPALPLTVYSYSNGLWNAVTAFTDDARCQGAIREIPAGSSVTLSFAPWQRTLFLEPGEYRVSLPITVDGQEREYHADFEKLAPGIFRTFWNSVFYDPLYNLLVFLIEGFKGSFGWALVVFVLCVRVLLIYPYQKSMVAQRKMQKLQPELDKIKERHAGDQTALAQASMALFKREKVSPFGSILPIFLQMPFFLAVFWIIQGGLLENNFIRLYPALQDFSFTMVTTNFYGLDLTQPNLFLLPPLVGILQFLQIRLSMVAQKQAPASGNPMQDALKNMQKIMQYLLPIMMVVFTALWPAAVGMYWAVSTLFGVGQQFVVNKLVK